jgi:hypothetical protein
MAQGTGQEKIDELVDTLRRWQKIERKSIEHTAEIMEKTTLADLVAQ